MEDKDKENFETGMACLSKKRAEIDETAHLKKYIVWENKSNICWLDASMALIAHNKVMKRASQVSASCKISKIIASYAEAISDINNLDKSSISWVDILNLAKSKLNCVQESTLQYLQPILKYKPGDPDSAFCSLYNLLKEDCIIKGIFDVTWISVKICTNCGHHTESTKTKPLITLSKIDSFDPRSPTVIYNCNCDKSEQKINFVFVTLPPCLIFHFENGAGDKKPPLHFVTQSRQYYLTGIMTLEKGQESNINHFITWVRDPFVDKWLDCNDLNPDIVYFTPNFPDIRFEDVSFYVYESFDDLGTIRDYKKINIKNSEEDIVLIDISEESASDHSNSVSNVSGPDADANKHEVPSTDSQVITFPTEIYTKSQKDILDTNENHNSDKKQEDLAESSETLCNEIKNSENDKNAKETIMKSPDQRADYNTQKTVDSRLQDFRISDDKSSKELSEQVIQSNHKDKTNIEEYKLNSQISTCSDQKQTGEKDTFALYEEKNLENIVANEYQNGIEVKESKQYKTLLPAKELHVSHLGDRKPEDITKADMAKSGTSYVKLSFRRKKYPGLTFLKQNSLKNDNKYSLDNSKNANVRKSPRSVKETSDLKRKKDEEWNTVPPQKRPRKNQKVKKTEGLKPNANKKDVSHLVLNKDTIFSPQDKSKIKNIVEKKIQQNRKISLLTSKKNKSTKKCNQVFKNQQRCPREFSVTGNSNENDNEGKILKEFEDVWSSHAPDCNCEHANLDETIDTVVDYTFAYLCKLSEEFKKANGH